MIVITIFILIAGWQCLKFTVAVHEEIKNKKFPDEEKENEKTNDC